MPAGFKVRWTNAAERDLLRIIEYLAGDSVVNAAALSKRIRLPGAVPRASALLGAVAALASLVPAARAARMNPTSTLREE